MAAESKLCLGKKPVKYILYRAADEEEEEEEEEEEREDHNEDEDDNDEEKEEAEKDQKNNKINNKKNPNKTKNKNNTLSSNYIIFTSSRNNAEITRYQFPMILSLTSKH